MDIPQGTRQRLEERRSIDPDTGCWEWQGPLFDGYGTIGIKGKNPRIHRLAYEIYVGPIPDGLTIDHLCRNRGCFNPEHLEPVTRGENVRRGLAGWNNAVKTHCPKGHPYDAENTYNRPDGGGRVCRICKKALRRRASLRAAEAKVVSSGPAGSGLGCQGEE